MVGRRRAFAPSRAKKYSPSKACPLLSVSTKVKGGFLFEKLEKPSMARRPCPLPRSRPWLDHLRIDFCRSVPMINFHAAHKIHLVAVGSAFRRLGSISSPH